MNDVDQARAALRRGRPSEALVFLWNALEPARLGGDDGALRTIAGLAERVARAGDEAERREAERLVAEIQGVARDEAAVPATEQMGAEVSVGGETVARDPSLAEPLGAEGASADAEPEEQPAPGRGARIMNVMWLLLVLGIILLNVIRGVTD